MTDIDYEKPIPASSTVLVDGLVQPSFVPRIDLTKAEHEYLLKLFKKTVPVLSEVFEDNPCCFYTGATDRSGYGQHNPPAKAKTTSRSTLVHRYVYEVISGERLEWSKDKDGRKISVDHACNHPSCINPSHLRVLPLDINRKLGDHRKIYNEGEGSF